MTAEKAERTGAIGGFAAGQGAKEAYIHLNGLLAGTVINDRYEILERLGSGGFGVVFAARDRVLRSEVAVKFLHPGLSEDETRFLRVRREINLSRRIADPRIVRVFSLETWRGLHFLVMERVRGSSLAEFLGKRNQAISWQEFAPIFLAILDGVKVLHRHGIVHRDLKPSNIFLVDKGIKILDFGMAKALDDPEQTADLDEIVGSPRYMSPEQIQGRKVGLTSDIYQLGLILYRALTGRHPFSEHETTVKVLIQHLQTPPPALEVQGDRLPRFIQNVVFKALEKEPRRRFASVETMAAVLRKGRAHRLGFSRWWRRHIAALGIGLLVLTAVALWQGFPMGITAVNFSGSRVTGRDLFGLKRWQENFAPLSVFQAFPVDLQEAVSLSWSFQPRGRAGAIVLLTHPRNKQFPVNLSLGSPVTDNRLVVLDGRGREMYRKPFWERFHLDDHGFTKRFYVSRYESRDVDGDGLVEQVMLLRQSQSMYPAAMVVMRDLKTFVYTSPGVIAHYGFVKGSGGGTDVLIVGMTNPLAHMYYLARVPLVLRVPDFRVDALPNLIKGATGSRHGMQVLLPGAVRIKEIQSDGRVRMWDSRSGASLEWLPRRGLILQEQKGRMRILDDPRDFNRALTFMHRAYRARALYHVDKALDEIQAALSLSLDNPYLKSALSYWAGDLRVERGEWVEGRRRLEAALDAYEFNMDAACRLCELTLLAGHPRAAVRLVEDRFADHWAFWGLSRGNLLFQAWCQLHLGEFRKSRETLKQLFMDWPDLATIFLGLTDIFNGDYAAACDAFDRAALFPPNLFTVAEFRLLHARALVAAGRNPERARFFLSDLETHSLRQGWRTGVLLAWLEARQGDRPADLALRARDAWRCIRDRSRGDFQARLWLFLDAWCYGRLMETLGNVPAAREGYRACVAANPHTSAAADARRRLSRLSK